MKIFLISGAAGSGKNLVSQYIKEYYEEKNTILKEVDRNEH